KLARVQADECHRGHAAGRAGGLDHLSGQQRSERCHGQAVPTGRLALRAVPRRNPDDADAAVPRRRGQRGSVADRHAEPEDGLTMTASSSTKGQAGAVLEANDLYRFYHAGDDETFALRGVSLTVATGEILAVVGPSGSGKSTLLACLAGLDEPDGGSVSVAGARITRRPEAQRAGLRARWIGILQQSGNLLDHLSVENN